MKKVTVIGGGVAGMSAAIELIEKGLDVTLIESSDKLGGKVNGWYDNQGHSMEHGMHGWWLEYHNFRDLLKRVGLLENLTEPISPFNFRGKLSSIRAGLGIAKFDPLKDYKRFDTIDFRSWLIRKGVSESAYEAIYRPTILSNLFLPPEKISAAAGINAILRGLRRKDSWKFAWCRGNTNSHLWEPLKAYFEKQGGKVLLNHSLTKLNFQNKTVRSVILNHTTGVKSIKTDYVVLALDIVAIQKIINKSLLRSNYFLKILNLEATDVLVTRNWIYGQLNFQNDHGVLNRFRIVDAFINVSAIQSESKKDGMILIETQSYIGQEWMELPDEEIEQLVRADIIEAFPDLDYENIKTTKIIKHRRIFSAFKPGSDSFRPTVKTPLDNLFLAGDWVKTNIPVMFMENAVLTGRCAANGILDIEDLPKAEIIKLSPPDLPIIFLRWLNNQVGKLKRIIKRIIGYESINQ